MHCRGPSLCFLLAQQYLASKPNGRLCHARATAAVCIHREKKDPDYLAIVEDFAADIGALELAFSNAW